MRARLRARAWLAALLLPLAATAGEEDTAGKGNPLDAVESVYLHAGAYTHFADNDDYQGPPLFGGLEARFSGRHLAGLSLFNNSYGQFSQYAYYGYKWPLTKLSPHAHLKLTGGVLHGYRGRFEDKVPLNKNGFSPAIIPAIGWKRGGVGVDVALLGTSGILFTVGFDVWSR